MRKAYVPILIIQFVLMAAFGIYAALQRARADAARMVADEALEKMQEAEKYAEILVAETHKQKEIARQNEILAVAARTEMEQCCKKKK